MHPSIYTSIHPIQSYIFSSLIILLQMVILIIDESVVIHHLNLSINVHKKCPLQNAGALDDGNQCLV